MQSKGSVTIPLYQCLFSESGVITHWAVSFERSMYDSLPHLYLVCVADAGRTPRQVTCAFMVKTSSHHDDVGFADALSIASSSMDNLRPHLGEGARLLPARIGLQGDPPSEEEFLRLALQQYTKLSAVGSA